MKKTVKYQNHDKRIARLGKKILQAYASMAMWQNTEYFDPINKLQAEIATVIANACICEVFSCLGIYAFVCAAHEHWNTTEKIHGEYVRADKNAENLSAAIEDLSYANWPCPGHIQFWDWVAELRRRSRYWNNGSEIARAAFQRNSWERIVDWKDFDWTLGFDIIDYDEFDGRMVVGYLLDYDRTPMYIENRDNLWIAGSFTDKAWRNKEYYSRGWRNPFAAYFSARREPEYPGRGWYNGPGTEIIPCEDDDDDEN